MAAMVKMVTPKGMTEIGFGGINYKVGKDGTVEVPAFAVEDMKSHGLQIPKPKDDA